MEIYMMGQMIRPGQINVRSLRDDFISRTCTPEDTSWSILLSRVTQICCNCRSVYLKLNSSNEAYKYNYSRKMTRDKQLPPSMLCKVVMSDSKGVDIGIVFMCSCSRGITLVNSSTIQNVASC